MRDRVRKPKAPRVEAEAFRGVCFCIVFRIADDRAPGIGEVDPDLVATPGLKAQFHEGASPVSFQHAIMGDGVPGGVTGGDTEDLEWIRLVEPGLERPFVVGEIPFNHGLIALSA